MAPWNPTDAAPFVHPDTHHIVQPGEWYDVPRGQEQPVEAEAEALQGPVKLPAAEWPAREVLDTELTVPKLKAWATVQELEFPASITKADLLALIDTHRPKPTGGSE